MKIIMTVGLPRSGKSTWARSMGLPIVNPDSVRLAVHGQRYYAPAEPLVWATVGIMIEALRLAGCETIILDATNTVSKRRNEWEKRYPGCIEHKVFNTSPAECIRRALETNQPDLVPVIKDMAMQWDYPPDE